MIAGVATDDDRRVDQDHEEAEAQREQRRPGSLRRAGRAVGAGGRALQVMDVVNTRPWTMLPMQADP